MSFGEFVMGKEEYDKQVAAMVAKRLAEQNLAFTKYANDLTKHIVQVFDNDGSGFPTNIGSATLLKRGDKRFLITASHVITTTSKIFQNGKLEAIQTTRAVKSDLSKNESEDIYIAELKGDTFFQPYNDYYDLNQIDYLFPSENNVIGFIGFPNGVNGEKLDNESEFKNEPRLYWGFRRHISEKGFDEERHLGLEIDINNVLHTLEENNEAHPGESPVGCSGGPVFLFSENIEKMIKLEFQSQLAGICIQHWREDKKLIAHNFEHILNVMRVFGFIENTGNLFRESEIRKLYPPI